MRLSRVLLPMLPWLLCVACVAARREAFDPAAYAPFSSAGTSVVHGRAFVADDTGAWLSAAGRDVQLQPATPYAAEWFTRVVERDEDLGPPDPRLAPFVRTAVAGDDGSFRFIGLPPGEYFLTCRITWVTAALQGRVSSHGAWAFARLHVPADTTLDVQLGGPQSTGGGEPQR